MLADDFERELGIWERRGRGYEIWPELVDLEPAYTPLLSGYRKSEPAVVDDGRRPGLRDGLKALLSSRAVEPALKAVARPSPKPFGARTSARLCELQLVLPAGFVVHGAHAAQFLASLHNLAHPVAFELLGMPQGIVVQLCCGERDKTPILENLRAFFPEAKIRNHSGILQSEWSERPRFGTLIDFGLSEYFFRSLNVERRFETDPLIGAIGALNDLADAELGLVQVLFQSATENWGNDLYAVLDGLEGMTPVLSLVKAKFREPMSAALVRVAALADTPSVAFDRARRLGNALMAATQSDMNVLIPLDNEGYDDALHAQDILKRETHRSGMLLNLSELLTLVHLPSASVRADRMHRLNERTKKAPDFAIGHALALGVNEHDEELAEVTLSVEQRLRHAYVIGASGTGKSTLLLSMIVQDLAQGAGLALLDPHGDLVDDVLSRIPDDRLADVVVFDPADEAFPVGFNILDAHSDLEKTLLSSDLVGVFRRLSTSWGDQMTSVLGNAVLAFLESTAGGTLLDLRRFLVDASFRNAFLDTVGDPEVVYFWRREFPLLKAMPQAPLLTRLDTFLRPKLIRYMVAQRHDQLDMRSIMDGRKVLLAKLSQGAIGEENSHLLGSLLVAKLNQAAMSRQDVAGGSRTPFFLYIDEFHNFVTPSIASILTGARKYGLGLTLAHQDLRQLKGSSDDLASAVLGNAYTRIVFRVGDQDARTLSDGFSFFEATDLQNLGIGRAIARIERADFDFNLRTDRLVHVDPALASARRHSAITQSRDSFAVPRTLVEEELLAAAAAEEAARERETQEKEQKKRQSDSKRSAPRTTTKAAAATRLVEPLSRHIAELAGRKGSGSPRASLRPSVGLEPGRGGPQHKYLQALLKRSAEDRGFRATTERPVLGGHGHIDVAIEGQGLSVACEISVTTTAEHELSNLSKCVAAGFDYVVLVSADKKTLRAAQEAMLSEGGSDERLRFLTPDAFMGFLDQLVADQRATTTTVRGYKVNVKYRAVAEEERKQKERILADVISSSLRTSLKTKK